MIGKTNSVAGGKLKSEKLNLTLKTNQASHTDLVGATFTVAYANVSTSYTWAGSEMLIEIPPYVDYSITFGNVANYKKPDAYTSTAVEGNSKTLEFEYNTELVSVTLSADDGSSVNGAQVTINGTTRTFNGSAVTQKVAFDTTYSVSVSDMDGFATPAAQTGITASQSARNLAFTYIASSLKVNISSNQGSDSTIAAVKATVSYGNTSVQVSSGEQIVIPNNQEVTITFPAVDGYLTPDPITFTNSNGGVAEKSGEYKCSVVTVTLTDNQTSYNDISSATATVTGDASGTLSSGGTIKVPWGGGITVTGSSVSGYKTPSATYTAADVTKAITLTYATEILTVTVGTDGATPSGYTVTVVNATSGATIGSQTTASKTYKIPADTKYYVKASSISGFTAPSNSSTVTASSSSNAKNSVTMTYAEIKNETLTVTVSGISSGFTVTVVNSSTGATIGSQTTTSKTYSITAGTKYYVKGSSVNGYVSPSNSATRTAVAGASHSVTMVYTAHAGTTNPSNGVYIRDTDGCFHTTSAWDGTYTADSVAVITSNCSFRIALADAYDSTCQWGGYGETVSGIVTSTSESTAAADYNGESNTTTIINYLNGVNDGYVTGAPAAEYCRSYTFPDGSKGYLGAAGEWLAALDNISAIVAALSACGGTAMSGYYWTSTQYSSDNSWYLHWNREGLNANYKSSDNYVRAFAAI